MLKGLLQSIGLLAEEKRRFRSRDFAAVKINL